MEEGKLSDKQLKLSVLIENCINFNVLLFNEVKVKHINLEKENIRKIKMDILKNNRNCLNNLMHYESSLMSNNVIDLILECYREIKIVFIKVLNNQNFLFIQAAIENTKLFYQLPYNIQCDYILTLLYHRYKKGKSTFSKNDEIKIEKYTFEINYLFEYAHFCKLMLIYAYQWSIENKDLEMAKKICCHKEIVKSVIFLNACEKNDKKLIRKYLMDDHININIISKLGKTPLDMAILKFNQELIDLLLAQDKLDINYKGLGGNTALMTAVECGNYEAMKNLLDHKYIDINMSNDYGGTALMYATSNAVDNKENVHILVTKPDINLNLKDENEETALLLSIKCKNIKIADYLVKQKQVDINTKNIFGDCPLLLAIEYPNMHPLVDSLLLREDLEVNIQNRNLSTPLMLAIQNNYIEIVKKLLAHPKIDMNLKDSDGETALSISLKHGFFNLSRLLIHHPGISHEEKENFFKCLSTTSTSLSNPPTLNNSEQSSSLSSLPLSSILGQPQTVSLIKYWFNCKEEKDFDLEGWLIQYSEEKTKQVFQYIFQYDESVSKILSPSNIQTNSVHHHINNKKTHLTSSEIKNINLNQNNNNNNNNNNNLSNENEKNNSIQQNTHKNEMNNKLSSKSSTNHYHYRQVECSLDRLKYLKSKIQNFIIENIINAQNSYGYSMLMILISINDMENIKKLLKYPFININLQDRFGETALIKAVNNDKIELVKTLINEYHPMYPVEDQNTTLSNNHHDSNSILHLNSQSLEKLEDLSKEINIYYNSTKNKLKSYIDTSLKDSSGYNAKKISYIYGNKEIEKLIDDYEKSIPQN